MKKIRRILLTFLISFFSLSIYGGIICHAKNSAVLIVPNGYENYMNFSTPIDLAVNENYYIIAESDKLYIYDISNKEYNIVPLSFTAEKIYSNSRGIFILSDTSIYFCEYNSDQFNQIVPSGNTFAINDNYLITATTNNIKFYEYIDNIYTQDTAKTTSLTTGNMTVPYLYFKNGNEYEYKIGNYSNYNTTSIASDGNDIYFIGNNGLYKKSEEIYTKLSDTTTFTALKYFNGTIYLTEKNESRAKMTAFDIATQSFSNFEISSNSSSDGRLDNAEDIFGINDKLYIADTLNKRISINSKDGTFLNKISLDYYPYLIGANSENALAVTSPTSTLEGESMVYFINLKNLTNDTPAEQLINTLLNEKTYTSLAASDDYFYLLTENDNEKNAELTIIDNDKNIKNIKFINTLYPIKISCDINGILFVLFNNGVIAKYSDNLTQTEILNEGQNVAQFNITGTNILKFILDITQSPYILTDDYKIYYLDNEQTFSNVFKLYDENIKSLASFYDDSNVYCLFSNGILKDTTITLQTLNSIPIPDYSLTENLEILTIKLGMPLLLFNYNDLEGSETFPITGYIKLETDLNVIKLFETDEHIVFTGKYTGLVTKDLTNVYPCIDTITTPANFSGYVSSITNIYNYPVLNTDFSNMSLDKYSQVSIKSLVNLTDLSCQFYEIEYDDAKTGFIPASFVLSALIENPINEDEFYYNNIIDTAVTLYTDKDLSESLCDIAGGTNVKVYSIDNLIAKISFEKEEIIYIGYINSEYLLQKGTNTLRNVIIILIVVLSFTITSLYFLKSKKKNL